MRPRYLLFSARFLGSMLIDTSSAVLCRFFVYRCSTHDWFVGCMYDNFDTVLESFLTLFSALCHPTYAVRCTQLSSCPFLLVANVCSQSDAMTDSRLQVRRPVYQDGAGCRYST